MLVTRDVNLHKEADCSKQNLFINSVDAKKVLLDYFTLYERIERQPVTYKGEVYKLNDVCEKADDSSDVCKVS